VRAWILDTSPGNYRLGLADEPVAGPSQVKVRLVASALNHMDLWLTLGAPKPPSLPMVPGCDGAGVVVEVGEGVDGWAAGDEVVLNPSLACGRCTECLADRSVFCDKWGILGEHAWGAHAERVVVGAANLVRRPAGRSWEECAAYGLCGLTAYRMLERARLAAGEALLVTGVGGGVATASLALGLKMGATVFVTSRHEQKREHALALGAAGAFASGERLPVKVDVVVDSTGAPTWEACLGALKKGGRLVTCGGTGGGRVEVALPRLFFGHFELVGSTMGTFREFDELTELVAGGLPVVVDSTYAFDDYPSALSRLGAGEQFGKVVLRHPGASG
jgi:zinc-binding alcohol dehydrogenase/oxidoreductase